MELLLSKPRGFCAGVDRAINAVNEALVHLPHPIYVNHEIVHNSHVIENFKSKGVIFVEGIDDVPHGATLIFNAHGVPPALTQQARDKQLKVVDATCPLVSKVHFEAIRYAENGYHILLVGHQGHPEVIGIVGEAEGRIDVIESVEDVAKLQFSSDDKLAYITQTTLSIDDCRSITLALKAKYPHIKMPKKSDICYATTNRQIAVKTIGASVDLIIVVGSQNSSNSNRLREVAAKGGKRAYLVDSAASLRKDWFKPADKVGITAGASTPEVIVQEVVSWLKSHFEVSREEEAVVIQEDEIFSLPKIS